MYKFVFLHFFPHSYHIFCLIISEEKGTNFYKCPTIKYRIWDTEVRRDRNHIHHLFPLYFSVTLFPHHILLASTIFIGNHTYNRLYTAMPCHRKTLNLNGSHIFISITHIFMCVYSAHYYHRLIDTKDLSLYRFMGMSVVVVVYAIVKNIRFRIK